MFVDISLDCVVSETTMLHPPQSSTNTFPNFAYSRRVMRVLISSLYSVVSDGHFWGVFVPLPLAVSIGIPQEANISLDAVVRRIAFLSAVFVMFHLRYQSTLIHFPPSIRPM